VQILNGLYLGNLRDSRDAAQLTQNCITHIISVHDNAKPLQAVRMSSLLSYTTWTLMTFNHRFLLGFPPGVVLKEKLKGHGFYVHNVLPVSQSTMV